MIGAWIMLVIPAAGQSLGYDAYSYWFVDLAERYALAEDSLYALGAFRYAPPVGMVFGLLAAFPWWLFLWLWMALSLGTALWLGGSRAVLILALPPVALELYHGNVHLLMAAAIVLGFRHPWAWAFVLLTKITPLSSPWPVRSSWAMPSRGRCSGHRVRSSRSTPRCSPLAEPDRGEGGRMHALESQGRGGVAQWQSNGLISRRSWVRIPPPPPRPIPE